MHKVQKNKTIIITLLAILFGAASLVNVSNPDLPSYPFVSVVRYLLIVTSILLFFIMPGHGKFNMPIKPLPLSFLWAAFSFFVILSGFASNDLLAIEQGFWSMIGIPIIFFNALPKLINKSANLVITLGLLWGTFPYIFLSFLLNPVWQNEGGSYSGVFHNSNGLGITTTIVSSCLFVLSIGILNSTENCSDVILLDNNISGILREKLLVKKSKWKANLKQLVINILLIMCFLVILLSNSRTSTVAFTGMSFLFFFKLFKNIKNAIFTLTIFSIVAAIVLLLNNQNPLMFERIFAIQDKELLSGRNDIWAKAVIDMQLLGNGSKYFEAEFGLGAHNSIIHILGIHGLFACLLMILFAITSFYYAVLYFSKNSKEDPYAIAPIVFITCFWLLSMGEAMFGGLGNAMTVTYMLFIGVIMCDLNETDNKKTTINILNNSNANSDLHTKLIKQ